MFIVPPLDGHAIVFRKVRQLIIFMNPALKGDRDRIKHRTVASKCENIPPLLYTYYSARRFKGVLDIVAKKAVVCLLWNFKGEFGIMDSGRKEADYTEWYEHKLDSGLLPFLKKQ